MSGIGRRARNLDATDEALMSRHAGGDVAGFEELFRRYQPRAHSFFLRRTGSRERTQDLYQELFLRIHQARHRYDPTRPFAPWFFQIASRLLVDDHRRAFRNHEVPAGDEQARSALRGSDDVLADREQAGELLERLSPDERYVVLSAKIEGIGYAEIAERLGRSADGVKKMASRAIQRLRASAAPTPAV
jgi:RNA polymerase sigma-70 factor (ECF subfamily)